MTIKGDVTTFIKREPIQQRIVEAESYPELFSKFREVAKKLLGEDVVLHCLQNERDIGYYASNKKDVEMIRFRCSGNKVYHYKSVMENTSDRFYSYHVKVMDIESWTSYQYEGFGITADIAVLSCYQRLKDYHAFFRRHDVENVTWTKVSGNPSFYYGPYLVTLHLTRLWDNGNKEFVKDIKYRKNFTELLTR